MKTPILLSVIFLAFQVHAHEAHEHGVARMDIAIDGERVSVDFETPLANLLPFEHAPSTPAQLKKVKEMARKMYQPETLFRLTPSAECRSDIVTLASNTLDAAQLDPVEPIAPARKAARQESRAKGEETHGDLDASFTFICGKPEKLNSMDVKLFSVWPKLKKIETQISSPRGQRAASLTPGKPLSW